MGVGCQTRALSVLSSSTIHRSETRKGRRLTWQIPYAWKVWRGRYGGVKEGI